MNKIDFWCELVDRSARSGDSFSHFPNRVRSARSGADKVEAEADQGEAIYWLFHEATDLNELSVRGKPNFAQVRIGIRFNIAKI